MATARELALTILPILEANVLASRRCSYGAYAAHVGVDPARESMLIGPVMHAIGAACVFAKIPVAPLYYLKRADGKRCGVFEEDPLESTCVLRHYNLLYVTAREYQYSSTEFGRLRRVLSEVVPGDWSPHFMWHVAIVKKPENEAQTYLESALATYEQIMGRLRSEVEHRDVL